MQNTNEHIATARLNEYVTRGQAAAPAALARLAEMRPVDTIAPMSRVTFSPEMEAVLDQHARQTMHENAIRQAAVRADLPAKYVTRLLQSGEWGKALLSQNLTELFGHDTGRVLMRSVAGEVRAVFSDSYRRFDSFPVIESFAEAVADSGGIVTEVNVTDVNAAVKAIIPEVIWVNGDPIVLGARLRVSDFKAGAIEETLFIFRLLCWNGMVGERVARQIHIGKRVSDDSFFSEKTRALDTATMASAIGDLTRAQFNVDAMTEKKARVERAAGTEIDPKESFKILGKILTKAELEKTQETFMFGNVDQVPDGRTAWRLGNALSFIAKSATNADRGMALERLGGAVIENPTFTVNLLDNILAQHELMEAAVKAA
jgi:hypothetical protein